MKDDKPRCRNCSKYCGYNADSGTQYGCADPGNPEPYDPIFWCKNCATIEFENALKEGEKMYVYWIMPNWQLRALEKLKLQKVGHQLVNV